MISASSLAIVALMVVALTAFVWGMKARRALRATRAMPAKSSAPIEVPVVAKPEPVDNGLLDECLRLRAQVALLERELVSLSYSVSHDLRAPLRGIDGFSQALIEDYGTSLDATARNYLTRVRANAVQLNALIEDLLTLSRVARAPFEPVAVDLGVVAAGIAADLTAADPRRTVHWDLPATLPARGDRALLTEMLHQLFDNAWKFTANRDEAHIALRVLPADPLYADGPIYQIADNGAGFDLQYAGRLFGAFQRMHTADEFPGRGVGLAMAQRIVARHGGRIWAQTASGQGAKFNFTLEPARVGAGDDALVAGEMPLRVSASAGAEDAALSKATSI